MIAEPCPSPHPESTQNRVRLEECVLVKSDVMFMVALKLEAHFTQKKRLK